MLVGNMLDHPLARFADALRQGLQSGLHDVMVLLFRRMSRLGTNPRFVHGDLERLEMRRRVEIELFETIRQFAFDLLQRRQSEFGLLQSRGQSMFDLQTRGQFDFDLLQTRRHFAIELLQTRGHFTVDPVQAGRHFDVDILQAVGHVASDLGVRRPDNLLNLTPRCI
jgi:hypothetical protein